MDLLFVPNLGDKRKNHEPKWGAEFFADAFKQYSSHHVTVEHNLNNVNEYDLVWVHNIANLLKGITGRARTLNALLGRHPPIIGGVRGEIGLKTAKQFLRFFNAIHTGNANLTQAAKQYNPETFTLASGVNPTWYTPHPQPKGFCIGWAGDAKKKMKNLDLVASLGVPIRWAIKSPNQYIPHKQMPERFYHRINALVHPSTHEGSSRVVAEAAACGLPIICTDVGHNDTIVSPEWLITLDNPKPQIYALLERLKEDRELAKSVGVDNQNAARKYMWPNIIKEAEQIITDVLKC